MSKSTFPINYFSSIWTPKKAFEGHKQLNGSQIVIVLLFLTLLMGIPVYAHYQQIDYFSISDFYPNAVELIDEETLKVLNQAEYLDGEMHTSEINYSKENDHEVVGVGVPLNELQDADGKDNFLLFDSKHFVIGDATGNVETIPYTEDFSLRQAATKEDVLLELSRQYTEQNHGSIVFSFTLVIYLFILMASLFIVLVYAYLLTVVKDFTLSSVQTYKESVNLILNLLGLPTLMAFFIGFYRFNVVTMLAIQIIGLIFMLLLLYKQTKFQAASVRN